jgi:phage gp46-like protein
MAKSWDLDPKTGDYIMQGGSPVETDSLRIPAYIRLKVRRAEWLYAPDDDYGSDFHLIKKRKSTDDASNLEAIGARALQPIADDGRASLITVDTIAVSRHNVGLRTEIEDAGGEVETLDLPQI